VHEEKILQISVLLSYSLSNILDSGPRRLILEENRRKFTSLLMQKWKVGRKRKFPVSNEDMDTGVAHVNITTPSIL